MRPRVLTASHKCSERLVELVGGRMWSLYLGSSTRDFLVECVGKSHSSKMRRVLESASHRVCTLVVAVQFSVVSSEVL